MGYALESMRKIRTMREERAGTELTGARRARAAAERERDEKAEARAQFEATKDVRRDRIYAAVMGRRVTRDVLDRAREAVTRIDEEGVLLAEAERAAQATLETRDREADAAKVRYAAAARNKAKIEQHRHVWEEEDRRLQELRADMELEEFTGRRLTSDDDDTFD
ncbi:MAG: YscO family type III secretion system apparatus protein [bacterium]|nr:YscO family type III secretion system apparatus protein [bacterium]MDO5314147.1 YscO family type III secretion system apparatus protein [bacterium]